MTYTVNTSIRPLLVTLLCGYWLTGCSQHDSASAETAASPGATTAVPEIALPTDDPCKLLTDAEVRKVFPNATSGRRDHSLDKYSIMTCLWDTPTDRFVVQLFKAKSSSVEDELRSRVAGSIDPLKPGAGDHVRYEMVADSGGQTMLVVEKAAPQRGILADTAVLVTRRGDRMSVLFTGSLAGGDRASAVKALETLGRSVATRL